jgi:hypothetical protein
MTTVRRSVNTSPPVAAQLVEPRNTEWKGWLSTIDLIEVAYFCKDINNVYNIKSGWSKLGQGGQLSWALPFGKGSLVEHLTSDLKVDLHNSDYRSKLVPFEAQKNIFYI